MINSTISLSPQKKLHPKFFDLGHPFEKILHSWGSSRIQRMLTPRETTYAPLERMTLLTGTLNGTLVVRSSQEFAAQLRNLRADSSLGRYNETEVFEEMVSLYSLYLFHDFWIPHDFQVGPIHPFRSVPADWPASQPHAVSNYLVDGFPVEIRLWMKD
jgi:hypothetical protein